MFNNKKCHANSVFSRSLSYFCMHAHVLSTRAISRLLFFIAAARTESCIVCCSRSLSLYEIR
jgi:hypothetical protein